MALAARPIAYCSNVHPAASLEDLKEQLTKHAIPAADAFGRPIGVGLWLPRSALERIDDQQFADFQAWFQDHGLSTTTMNAFPFGDFHARRVKENVYLPDWTQPERRDYTCRAADFLAKLLPEDGEGSVSTLPCAYKRLSPTATASTFFAEFLSTARHLDRIRKETGKTIRLAIEPEPGCFLERTAEAVGFLSNLRAFAGAQSSELGDVVKEHLGVCFDVCHSAVMFEKPGDAVRSLAATGIRVAKVQISSALELRSPKDRAARKFLSQFVEDRYLHQTTAKIGERMLFAEDLTAATALTPSEEWKAADSWRVHFHVPIHKLEIGPLFTTTWAVDETLAAVNELSETPDLEVETYTWDVLPAIGKTGAPDLANGLAAELKYAQNVIDRLRA